MKDSLKPWTVKHAGLTITPHEARGGVFATLKGLGQYLRENKDIATKIGYVKSAERNPKLEQKGPGEGATVIRLQVSFFNEGNLEKDFYHVDDLLSYLKHELPQVYERLRAS